MIAYNPDVPRNEEQLCVSRKKCHSIPRTLLLLILSVHPRPVFEQFGHTPESLRMVYKRLVESLCQRRIRDVCENTSVSEGTGSWNTPPDTYHHV